MRAFDIEQYHRMATYMIICVFKEENRRFGNDAIGWHVLIVGDISMLHVLKHAFCGFFVSRAFGRRNPTSYGTWNGCARVPFEL